ncbi:MAG TPA: PadR family transcriptional regulator [Spirochaetia bacterium]|nr:PadR family transcriptional regulator [Spirochaetia bacterium]
MLTEIVVLALLKLGPKHGYDIRKKIDLLLSRNRKMNTNLLYPALHRLEKSGAVEREVHEQEGRPARHTYRITPEGALHFRNLIVNFGESDAAKDEEFIARVAFFDFLEEKERCVILEQRRAALQRRLAEARTKREIVAEVFKSIWVERIIRWRESRIFDELAWIDRLEKHALDSAAASAASASDKKD